MPTMAVDGVLLQEGNLPVYMAAVPGRWLLQHSTPSWRLEDPVHGFQRVVKAERAQEIAYSVLDQRRSFPNAVVLATDVHKPRYADGKLTLPANIRLLVVDGQHRIWAQNFSEYEACYACIIHFGLTEVEMARLFLEINDNQKRVPSSLRWDLVRLVRPQDDPYAIAASELVLALASNEESPLYQRIDLTGEQGEKDLKQGSIAPEFKSLLGNKKAGLRKLDFEDSYELVLRYLAALRDYDPDGWRAGDSPFLGARVMRAALRLLPDIIVESGFISNPLKLTAKILSSFLDKIPEQEIDLKNIRASQGTAGIKHIYETMKSYVFAE